MRRFGSWIAQNIPLACVLLAVVLGAIEWNARSCLRARTGEALPSVYQGPGR